MPIVQLDLLQALENIDSKARELLAELHALEAEPCASADIQVREQAGHELAPGAHLVLKVDEGAGRLLADQTPSEWIERLAEVSAALPSRASGEASESPPMGGEGNQTEEACLAGRIDYRLGRGDECAGHVALELWLREPPR